MPKSQQGSDVPSGATSYFPLPLLQSGPRAITDVGQEHTKRQSQLWRRSDSGLTAYQRHIRLIADYNKYYAGGRTAEPICTDQTDFDVLKAKHKFLLTDTDTPDTSYAARVARKYYDRLFKEYSLADLSRYRTSQVALRWRSRKEVVAAKGQFVCGELSCDGKEELRTWEVNFAYTEDGKRKNALVKLRLCLPCSYKLNYRKIKEKRKAERATRKRERTEKREIRITKRAKKSKTGAITEENNFYIDTVGDRLEESDSGSSLSDAGERGRSDGTHRKHEDGATPKHPKHPGAAYTEEEISAIWSAAQPVPSEEIAKGDDLDAYFADLFN